MTTPTPRSARERSTVCSTGQLAKSGRLCRAWMKDDVKWSAMITFFPTGTPSSQTGTGTRGPARWVDEMSRLRPARLTMRTPAMRKKLRHLICATHVAAVKLVSLHGAGVKQPIYNGGYPLTRVPARLSCTCGVSDKERDGSVTPPLIAAKATTLRRK